MQSSRHYSPRISRFLVSALFYQAKSEGIPMTHLVDRLLLERLQGGTGWTIAATQHPLPAAAKTDKAA